MSRTSGFRLVGECGDAESALKVLPEKEAEVVLMDINLPGMSGVEAVRKLKRVIPGTQFVMLTVYEDADHIYNALVAGATGYLLKQTKRADLLKALEDVHRGGSPMTSNIARKVVQSFREAHPAAANRDQRETDGVSQPSESKRCRISYPGIRMPDIGAPYIGALRCISYPAGRRTCWIAAFCLRPLSLPLPARSALQPFASWTQARPRPPGSSKSTSDVNTLPVATSTGWPVMTHSRRFSRLP